MVNTEYTLSLLNFSRLELTGVDEVTAFQDTQIELSLTDGILIIGGQDLKIKLFSQEEKRVVIHGQIDSLFREPPRPLKKARLFSRLFR